MALAEDRTRTTELVAVWCYPTYTTKGSAKVCVYEDDEMMLTVRQNLCNLSTFDLACYCYLDYKAAVYATYEQADGHEYLLLLTKHISKRALRSLVGLSWHKYDGIKQVPRDKLPEYPGLV